ncbi:aspartate aminotransferase family protein [Maritalea mediterranea]|uniref:Acetylornithine aminotransferase n=1 Tax=Maritalea mediterranea TaxID=2909667 RepID=A0ABS9E402_9HYPH|nr:aspartate aminotransferase family protein [Maritalea mediterranea]MCF4097586.1 aspartate aminotransferase family protein [Maritalea mediterranea]
MSALYQNYKRADLSFERGEGVRLFSSDGGEYLDFAAGIAVNALGHSDAHVVNALKEQSEKLWHVSNVFSIPEAEKLAQRLVDISFADMVFFTNSGAEAIECAIKTARRYFYDKGQPERYEIITLEGAFHGRTLGTIAAGGNEGYLTGFGPKAEGFPHVAGDLEAIKAAISDKTAGILLEPIQGESGINVFSNEFLRDLRALCDAHGILLIVDEIQCGYGRTGKMFAYEWAGIAPDIMALAKGIGGGFPLGACLAKEEIGASMVPGTHGSTYGGNPMACAVGNAVLDRISEVGFLAHVDEMGQYLSWSLQQLAQKFPDEVLEVRGKGLMAGIKVKQPVSDLLAKLRDHHLLAVGAGDNVVRFLPPLIVEKQDIDEAMNRMEKALSA